MLGLPIQPVRERVKFWLGKDGAKSFAQQTLSVSNHFFFRCAYHFYPSRTKDFLSCKSQSILYSWYRTLSEYILNANIRGYECCSLYIIVKWLSEPLCNSQCGNLFSPPNLINDPVPLWPFWPMVSINHSFASSPRLWKTGLHSQSGQWDKHGMNG